MDFLEKIYDCEEAAKNDPTPAAHSFENSKTNCFCLGNIKEVKQRATIF